MVEYQLKIRQRETFPRCRISQGFFQSLIEDRDIRTNGCPGLFAYTALCSLASCRLMYLRLEGISYTIQPGEWVCALTDIKDILRLRTLRQALEVLWVMQNRGLIQYTLLERGDAVRFKILDWGYTNRVLRDDCRNRDLNGFFLSATIVTDLVGSVKCSEMDILLDLLLSAVYRDSRVKGSYSGAVVYFRNASESAVVTYDKLSKRWGLSSAAVRRILEKFEEEGYITLHGSLGHPQMLIYLADNLTPMFQLSDTIVDKDELPMSMCVPFSMEENQLPGIGDLIAEKVMRLLDLQGIGCAKCRQCVHKLYPLPETVESQEKRMEFCMEIMCGWNIPTYTFEMFLYPNKD